MSPEPVLPKGQGGNRALGVVSQRNAGYWGKYNCKCSILITCLLDGARVLNAPGRYMIYSRRRVNLYLITPTHITPTMDQLQPTSRNSYFNLSRRLLHHKTYKTININIASEIK